MFPLDPPVPVCAALRPGALRRARRSAVTSAVVLAAVLGGLPSASAADVTTPFVPASADVAPTAQPARSALAATAGSAPLTWAPPALESPTTVTVSSSKLNLKLDLNRDYVIRMPAEPVVGTRGLVVYGGRNVVLVGGEVHVPVEGLTTDNQGGRGLYLKGQTGTIHVEGLRLSGPGLKEGINLDQRNGAVVQLQNIRVETVQGSYDGAHADVLQTWAGPRQLRVDGLTGHTQYQGFFMLPNQAYEGPQPELFDLRRVSLHGGPTSAYMLWRDSAPWPLALTDVWVAPRHPSTRSSFLWPKGTGTGTAAWPSVNVGAPAGGEFVPVGAAGTAYVSPGYTTASVPVAPPRETVPGQTPPGQTPPGETSSGTPADGSSARSPGYVPVAPARVHDVRTPVPSASVRCVQVAGVGGVPADADGAALNVTSVGPAGPGNLVVYPDPGSTATSAAPSTSTVNFVAGGDVANAAMVDLPANGRVCYLVRGAPTGVIIDVAGYTTPSSGIVLTRPARLEDRSGVLPGQPVTVQVTGRGVPAGATSVLVNVTAAGSRAAGNVQVFAQGATNPGTSALNLPRSGDKANAAIVQLSAGGALTYLTETAATNPVRVVLDVVGYTTSGSTYVPLPPVRVTDTRRTGAVQGGGRLEVAARLAAGVPADATAVVLNTVAVSPSAPGNLQVFPFRRASSARPSTSTLNYLVSTDVANMVVAGIGDDGAVSVYSDQAPWARTHVVVDVVGYMRGS